MISKKVQKVRGYVLKNINEALLFAVGFSLYKNRIHQPPNIDHILQILFLSIFVNDLAADFGPHDAEVRGLVFSPDGRRLVTGDASGKIYIWDVGGEERLIELEGHAAEITSLCFADEGRTLLSADVSGEVLAWRSNFDASRYKRWRKTDRVPLRAKRIIDFFGGDLGEAAARLRAGYPGLDASDSAVTFILDEAMKAASVSDVESPLEDF